MLTFAIPFGNESKFINTSECRRPSDNAVIGKNKQKGSIAQLV